MRVVGLLPGAFKGLQPIKYGPFVQALSTLIGEVDLWNVEPSRLDRLRVAAFTFSPDKARFRARFYASPLAFNARTRTVNRLVPGAASVDAFLQFGATFDAGLAAAHRPLVIYTDYTVALTRELGRSFRLALGDAQIDRCIKLERTALARADVICTRSRMVADALVALMGVAAHKIVVVGAGPNVIAEGQRATPPRLLFFGQEFQRKGGDLVLAAFDALRRDHDWLELDIVGGSPPGPLPAGIVWHSRPSAAQVARLLGQATILLSPSRFETWGDVIVEAMAAGVVPVVADLPPMTEIVRHGTDGLVVPREDHVALAAAVGSLLRDPSELSRLAQNACESVARTFNQEAVAARVAESIREAMRLRRAAM
jgi:glycosyltransferase involved in cell wall biosynthesis